MKDYIEERVLELARYITETGATVRSAAARFRVSKSTVHKDITERLLEIQGLLPKSRKSWKKTRLSVISAAVSLPVKSISTRSQTAIIIK